jgi:hypothetical protein
MNKPVSYELVWWKNGRFEHGFESLRVEQGRPPKDHPCDIPGNRANACEWSRQTAGARRTAGACDHRRQLADRVGGGIRDVVNVATSHTVM